MNRRRVMAMAGSDIKRAFRDPAFLFLTLMFPVALTVLFATAFGGLGGSAESFKVAVVDLDASGDDEWSSRLVDGLKGTGLIEVVPSSSAQEAKADLSDGELQALLIVPEGFDAACRSYVQSPDDPSLWTPITLQLMLDPGSMISMQALPPMIDQVMVGLIYGAPSPGPIALESIRIESSDHLTVFDHMAPGVITFASVFLTMIVGQSIANDRESGVLRRIATTPLAPSELVASRVLSNLAISSVQLTLVFGLLFALGSHFRSTAEGLAAAVVLVMLFSVCSVGLGLITAAVSRTPGQATMISFVFIMPQMFLGTFMGGTLSSEARAVSGTLPAHYVTDGLTTIMLRGGSLTSGAVPMDIAMIAMFAATALMAGTLLFRRMGAG